MKAYQITASNAVGRWRYVGIFTHSIDATISAMDMGATRISVRPL